MKRSLAITLVAFAAVMLTVGVVKAASEYNITSTLGGVSGDFFDLDGTLKVDSIKVGAQGVGGVTFFNGTIVNETTNSGVDNPVTFGDNVRIDGRVYRGAAAGTSDSMPFIVNDNMEVTGTLTVSGLSGSGIVSSNNIASNAITSAKVADGAIATEDLADNSVTQAVEDFSTTSQTTTKSGGDYDTAAEIEITTDDSNLFCTFSGYGTTDTPHQSITIALLVDDEIIDRTVRSATMGEGDGHIILNTSVILDVAAGDHTVQLGWNTDLGVTASLYANTLDCIELKK